jgi:hypothetical protein
MTGIVQRNVNTKSLLGSCDRGGVEGFNVSYYLDLMILVGHMDMG